MRTDKIVLFPNTHGCNRRVPLQAASRRNSIPPCHGRPKAGGNKQVDSVCFVTMTCKIDSVDNTLCTDLGFQSSGAPMKLP